MNTMITMKVVQDKESTVSIQEAIDAAFGEFDRIVKKYTRFNEDSELSNLNRMSGEWVKISDEFFMLMKVMLKMAQDTEGVFDPTIIDFLEIYGYDKNYDFSKLNNPQLDKIIQDTAKNRASWKDIELREDTKEVKLVNGQRIDLGGIGKGYAIDCAFDQIKKKAQNFLIDAGGDIRSAGKNAEDKVWRVELKALVDSVPSVVGEIELDNCAIASSGSWARKVKQFHHLINPVTGKPHAAKYSTVFVQAPTGTEADSWATALFVGGEFIEKRMPDGFSVMYA